MGVGLSPGGDRREHAARCPGLPARAQSGPRAGQAPAPGERPAGLEAAQAAAWGRARPHLAVTFPLALVQEGGGGLGRTRARKRSYHFTAEMTLAGENEKMPCVLLQFEGRVTKRLPWWGLERHYCNKANMSGRAARRRGHMTEAPGRAWARA